MTTSVLSYHFKILSLELNINWDIVLFFAPVTDAYDLFVINIILLFYDFGLLCMNMLTN